MLPERWVILGQSGKIISENGFPGKCKNGSFCTYISKQINTTLREKVYTISVFTHIGEKFSYFHAGFS